MDSINAPIHYSFLSGNPPNYREFFEINPNTGAVKQIKAVDTTVTKRFDIIIKVSGSSLFLIYFYLFIFFSSQLFQRGLTISSNYRIYYRVSTMFDEYVKFLLRARKRLIQFSYDDITRKSRDID